MKALSEAEGRYKQEKNSMTVKIFLGLALISIFVNCTQQNKATIHDGNILGKQSPKDTIVTLKLPLVISSENWDEMFKKYGKLGNNEEIKLLKHPFAKLVDNEIYEAIICTVPNEVDSPFFVTINKDGKIIDSLFLIGEYGGNDASIGIKEYALINNDMTINIIDSTFSFDVDKDYNRIESSEKLTVKNVLYKVLENGMIKKIK